MDNYIFNMVKIANDLDARGLTSLADRVDVEFKRVVAAKKILSQYESGLAYAVQNSRCFGNCYRMKRSEKPTLAAQEVWNECWDEYNDAVNTRDQSKFGKYASNDNYVLLFGEAENLIKNVNARKNAGEDLAIAIVDELDATVQEPVNELLASAEMLAKLASELTNNDELVKMMGISADLVKEAQFSGGGGNSFWRGVGNFYNRRFRKNDPRGQASYMNKFMDTARKLITQVLSTPHINEPGMETQKKFLLTQVQNKLRGTAVSLPGMAQQEAMKWVNSSMFQFADSLSAQMGHPVQPAQQAVANPAAAANPANAAAGKPLPTVQIGQNSNMPLQRPSTPNNAVPAAPAAAAGAGTAATQGNGVNGTTMSPISVDLQKLLAQIGGDKNQLLSLVQAL